MLVALGALVVIIGVILIIVYITTVRQGLSFVIVPGTMNAEINGKTYTISNDGRLALDPGIYTITFSRNEFSTSTSTVTVHKDSLTTVYIGLKPLTANAEKLVSDNDSQMRMEKISGANLGETVEALGKEYPFSEHLPITDKYFYAYSCNIDDKDISKGLKICVDLVIDEPYYRDRVITTLKSAGIDTDSTEITYSVGDF